MPNFWSNTSQALYEKMFGPRTVDTPFNDKVNELKQMTKEIEHAEKIYQNFSSHTAGTLNIT
jgi:hypothetical protein